MYQFFSPPDRYLRRCGDLQCFVVHRSIPGAPAFLRGVTALFLSDFHVTSRASDGQIAALAERMAALTPDLLLLGGDYADEPGQTRRLFRALRDVRAPLGAFGVVGNNDREAFPDPAELAELMDRAGIELLINARRDIPINGGTLCLSGLDEYRYGSPDPAGLVPGGGPDRYRLMLSHYPRTIHPMPDLMLCGHTHAGQFNLLGVTPYTLGFERLFVRHRASRFISGLHEYRGGRVLVSKGIGASRLPLRIGVRPEIDVISFEPSPHR